MESYINEYLTFLRIEKELSNGTISHHRTTLKLLHRFLMERETITSWDQVTYPHLRAFLHYLASDRDNSVSARSSKISDMKSFFSYLFLEEVIARPIADRLIKPKMEHKLPIYLSLDECQRFIRVIGAQSKHAVRDRTIILTFLYTGMRMSELVCLDLLDVNLEEEMIKVMGKGRKERYIPICPQLKEILIHYSAFRQQQLGILANHIHPFFISQHHQGWTRIQNKTIQNLFHQFSKEARINKEHFSAHKLRHTFATLLYASGVNLMELKHLLGHSNLSTTQIYTHTSVEQLRSAIDKHPLDIQEKKERYVH